MFDQIHDLKLLVKYLYSHFSFLPLSKRFLDVIVSALMRLSSVTFKRLQEQHHAKIYKINK